MRKVPSGLTKYGSLNTTNEEGWGRERERQRRLIIYTL
jgi:hypothetical protein